MKKIYFVLFAILCTIVFSCTDNLISTDLESDKMSNTSELRVFVKESRLYSPEANNISWSIKLVDNKKNSYTPKINGSYYLFTGLQSGIYTVNAIGKDSYGVERFSGVITFNFDARKKLEIHVPVTASKNSETSSFGYAKIKFEMSDLLKSIIVNNGYPFTAYLTSVSNYDVIYSASINDMDSKTLFDNQEVSFVLAGATQPTQTFDIPAGYYNLYFEGLGQTEYSIKLKDTLVEIGDGLTTNIVLTENDYEIVKNYSSILYVNNEGGEIADGKTLSNPIAFSQLNSDLLSEDVLIYLLSDVDFGCDTETENLYPNLGRFFGTISSFGSSLYSIKADNPSYTYPIYLGGDSPLTLKNVKLSGSNKFSFSNLFVDETVILDCEMDNNSTVQLSKKSNLQIGKNFSGDLYLSLNGDWKLGDTVINFENGKPENSNFYIEKNCCNSEFQSYSSMFYIDDSGKLAKYTDDFTSFAWFDLDTMPCLVTKTQAKNNTYTRIIDSTGNDLNGFNGISTYDEENQTWYFIANGYDANGNTVTSLYKVSASTEYTDTVSPEKIEVNGIPFDDVQAMAFDDGKLYFGYFLNSGYDFYSYDVSKEILTTTGWFSIHMTNANSFDLTSLLVKGNEVYFATTVTSTNDQTNNPTTHSAIWKYELTTDDSGGVQLTTKEENGHPVPYYLTHSDSELTVNGSFPSNAYVPAFRITDLYSDGTSVYGLLANYIEIDARTQNDKVYMRGSVFKLQENSTSANATHYGLRKDSLQISDITTAKQYFILPRKIVGIMNKKLIIADDGMIPDKNDCNLDRFILFDLDGSISEKIDVDVSFKTSGSTSGFATNTLF